MLYYLNVNFQDQRVKLRQLPRFACHSKKLHEWRTYEKVCTKAAAELRHSFRPIGDSHGCAYLRGCVTEVTC